MVRSVRYERSILFIFIAISCMRASSQCKETLSFYCKGQLNAPRVSLISSVDAFPSDRFVHRTTQIPCKMTMRTFHHDFHVVDQTVDYIERLGNSHLRLFEAKSIEALKNRFDICLSK